MRLPRSVVLLPLVLAACDDAPATPADASVADVPAVDAPAPNDLGVDAPATPPADVPPADVPLTIEPFAPSPRGPFPQGFLWGSATAPYQIEGGLDRTDWAQWERMPGRILNGDRANDGPQSYARFVADLDALVATHQNAYRLGFDWSRVFPTRAAWDRCSGARARPLAEFMTECRAAADPDGVAYYHRVLDAMAARRLVPMVTLFHFVLPDYLNDLAQPFDTQGFVRDGIADDFGAWSRFAGAEYGRQVDWWITLNEPLVIAAGGYLQGVFPPGAPLNFDRVRRLVTNMIRAHARGYDALHEADTFTASGNTDGGVGGTGGRPALVSIATHNRVFRAERPGNDADEAGARAAAYVNNDLFMNAIVRGDLDADADGALTGPTDRTNDPSLRARADYIGLNYYGLSLVRGLPTLPILRGLPQQTSLPTPLPKSDLDWDLYPQGFLLVLRELRRFDLPVVVTENGLADASGTNRPRYLAEHLAILARAAAEGLDVRGYFHWSIIDNFEWAEGFCPRFGLYTVDYRSPARTRVPTPGAETLRRIIDDNQVSDALLRDAPAYHAPTLCHPRADAGT
jgi:beta-glucosidase/6-phospho-beta-glucosidase/beta-galactosidase